MFKSRLALFSLLLGVVMLALLLFSSQNASSNIAHASGAATPLFGFGLDGAFLNEAPSLAVAEQTGAKWARMAVWWDHIEPDDRVPADYDWSSVDRDLNPVIQAGLIPVVYIGHTPSWAGPYACGPIDTSDSGKLADFAEVMGALAARYPQVPVWVLYNEADNAKGLNAVADGCFGDDDTGDLNQNGVPDTADYAEMLATARKAVRQANSDALVAISVALDNFDHATCPSGYPGGCLGNGTFNSHFLDDLFSYMKSHPRPSGEAYADLVGFDYWDIYSPYWEAQAGTQYHGNQAKAEFIRYLMGKDGVSFKLYVMATGVDSNLAAVGLDGQSQCLVTEMVRGAAAGLEGSSWWLIKDIPASNWYFGLVDENLTPKPAFHAYQTLSGQLEGYTFKKTVSTNKVEAYQFVKTSKKQFVVWSSVASAKSAIPCAGAHKSQKFTLTNVKKLRLVDLYQTTVTTVKDNKTGDYDPRVGIIKVKIGTRPMYIQVKK